MKNTLLFLCITQLLIPFASVEAETFEVPLLVVRRGQVNQPVGDIKIRAERFGASVIQGQIPGRTDQEGKAIIRFDSPMPKVEMLYRVVEHPDGGKWYVKFHGFYPTGNPDLPPHSANASPIQNPVLKLEAYPEAELAVVAMQDLVENRTGMVGAAVADAVVIPRIDRTIVGNMPLGNIQISDPFRSYENVANTLNTSPEVAKNLIKMWQSLVDAAPGASKPDEKSLSALLKGDIGKATVFAKIAADLNGLEKSKLVAASDTGRLAETLYQMNISAQNTASAPRNVAVEAELKKLEQIIKPLRPTREGRFPASTFDASKLGKFSETVRERAANIKE